MGADAGVAAGAVREMEAEIEKAMRARVPDIKKQADSLTLEGVRRALEKDLGLELYSLDAHKKFIKQCVDKVLAESDDENTNNNASENAEDKGGLLSKEGFDDVEPMPVSDKVPSSADQVVRPSEPENDSEGEKDQPSSIDISEDMIKEAIDKRASYFRKNTETLTLQGVRRTLEEDLKLQKKALDAYKKFITPELDKVLQEPANGTKKNSKKESLKDADQRKGSKRVHEDSDTSELNNSQSEMEDSDEEDKRPKKREAEKGKVMKKQKKVADEKKQSTPKVKKVTKRDSDRSKQGASSAEEDNSHSSAEEDNKRKHQQVQAPTYGKKVEHLKSIIKSCGMSIPPTVYRKAKQAPENKREACLIKELEDILEKEGLSKNPSEKEIKSVKKRKERARELEGIDMSNIITSSRRRSTSSFIPLPAPPKVVSDSDDDEDEDDAADDDEDDEENVEAGDEGDNDNATGDESADDAEKESD